MMYGTKRLIRDFSESHYKYAFSYSFFDSSSLPSPNPDSPMMHRSTQASVMYFNGQTYDLVGHDDNDILLFWKIAKRLKRYEAMWRM